MNRLVADTHAIIWYLLDSPHLSTAASAAMDAVLGSGDSITISSITMVELAYLAEKGRIPTAWLDAVDRAVGDASSGWSLTPLDQSVAEAVRRIPRGLVADMPDRIIAATALFLGLPLVSADSRFRTLSIPPIIW
jgi:PIN domain nuclease of toxin-antitoxin system